MAAAARAAVAAGTGVSLTFPNCFKSPPDFPKGEVMCVNGEGVTQSFEPDEVLAWLVDSGLVPEHESFLPVSHPVSSAAPR